MEGRQLLFQLRVQLLVRNEKYKMMDANETVV